jgi:hypothetical protein
MTENRFFTNYPPSRRARPASRYALRPGGSAALAGRQRAPSPSQERPFRLGGPPAGAAQGREIRR